MRAALAFVGACALLVSACAGGPSTFPAEYPSLGDAGASGDQPSLAIGRDGVPLISYLDDADENLALYVCSDPACRSGTVRALDEAGRTGFASAMTIGADGNPVIRYYDLTRGDLRFYACADPRCSAGSARTLVSEGDVGNTGSIAIGADGNPIITFSRDVNYVQHLEVYACADPTCTSGVVRDLGLTGLSSAIVIGTDGNPVISFRDGEADDLGLYACENPTCSTGTARVLDAGGRTGWDTAMAIGHDGNPLIAYCDATDGYVLRLYACSDATCSTGSARTLDTDGGLDPSIAIDPLGNPVISYAASPFGDFRDAIMVYACSTPDCSAGSALMPGTASVASGGTSIGMGPGGATVIAYGDSAYPGLGLHLIVVPQGVVPTPP